MNNGGQTMGQQGGQMGQMGGGGGDQDPNRPTGTDSYSALGLNDDPNMDWRDMRYRSKIRAQIDEQLRNVGQNGNLENGQKSVEWESQVFQRSKTREEYVKLVATLIIKLRDYKAKQNTQQRPQQVPNQGPQGQMGAQMNGQFQQQQNQQMMNNGQFAPRQQVPPNQQQQPNQGPMMQQQPQQYNQPQQQSMMNPRMNHTMNQVPRQQMMNQQHPQSQQQQQQQQQFQQMNNMNPRFRGPHHQQPQGGAMQQNMQQMQQNNSANPYGQSNFKPSASPISAPFNTPSPLNVPSPASSHGPGGHMMPNQGQQVQSVHPGQQQQQQQSQQPQQQQPNMTNDDQVLYMEKLKSLRKYIEPLSRIISRRESEGRQNPANIGRIKTEIQKLKSLRDIILGKNQVNLQILERCEPVLRQIAPVETPYNDDDKTRDQHMCQGLLDVVSSRIRNPNMNHTLNRTFGPILEKLRPEHTVTPRRVAVEETPTAAARPREIPSVLQGEVASLNKKFVARLDRSQSNSAGDVHIVVSINDLNLPPVKELKITIPRQYPSIPPIIQNECDDETKDAMDMAEYDEEDDFLKIQESFFEERLDSLGPDLVTLTQILSAWELSIRQALAKMNINYARDRQMMLPPPQAATV